MEQYIKKSAVKAELEKQVKRLEDAFNNPSFASYEANLIAKGGYRKLKDILAFIDTLEVKGVEEPSKDLEEEIENELERTWYGEYLDTDKFKESAVYFFELGLKAKGE